jgi:hypothetical protein
MREMRSKRWSNRVLRDMMWTVSRMMDGGGQSWRSVLESIRDAMPVRVRACAREAHDDKDDVNPISMHV